MKHFLEKLTITILSICIAITSFTVVLAADTITVYVNGERIHFDVDPVTENDRTLVPMRSIFEALGATVGWDETTSTATAVNGSDTLQIKIDSTVLMKNGREIILDVPARLIGGRTLVPVRAVSEGLGAEVEWDAEGSRVLITTGMDYNYMTDEQKAMLKEKAEDIRGDFVNRGLSYGVLVEYPEIGAYINQKDQEAINYVYDRWVDSAFSDILAIKRLSDPDFMIPQGQTIRQMTDKFLITLKEAGLHPADYFDTTFEDLADGRTMLLLNFKTTTHQFSGKYFGIVAMSDEQVRCFIAQPSSSGQNLFFCEALGDMKVKAIGNCGPEVSDFITAVNDFIK